MELEFRSMKDTFKEVSNNIIVGRMVDKFRYDCLRQVLGSVFIYDNEKQLPEKKYSKTEYLKFEHGDKLKQSLEKIDLAVYNLLRRLIVYLEENNKRFDFINSFDNISPEKFLKSRRLQMFIDGLNTCPEELFVYPEYEKDSGVIVLKMQYIGHTAKPLMKIEFSYPDYDFELKLLV